MRTILKKLLLATSIAVCICYADTQDDTTDSSPQNLPRAELSFIQSSALGWIIGTHFTNYIWDHRNALGFQLNGGGDEFRLGGTLAHVFSPLNRVKITAEHLAQRLTIDFIANPDNQYVGQNEVSGMYQHLIQNAFWKNFIVGGYYVRAESEIVSNYPFGTPLNPYIDIQTFTGAVGGGGVGGIAVEPWRYSRAEFDLNYDNITYDNQYIPRVQDKGVGGTFSFQQVFTGHIRGTAFASYRNPFQQYGAGLFYLFSTRPGTRLELGLQGTALTGDIFLGHDNRAILSLTYSWGGNPCGERANYLNEDPDNLITWASQPVLPMPTVLLQKDETVVRRLKLLQVI